MCCVRRRRVIITLHLPLFSRPKLTTRRQSASTVIVWTGPRLQAPSTIGRQPGYGCTTYYSNDTLATNNGKVARAKPRVIIICARVIIHKCAYDTSYDFPVSTSLVAFRKRNTGCRRVRNEKYCFNHFTGRRASVLWRTSLSSSWKTIDFVELTICKCDNDKNRRWKGTQYLYLGFLDKLAGKKLLSLSYENKWDKWRYLNDELVYL